MILFQPDNFSDSAIEYRPLDVTQIQEYRAVLKKYFSQYEIAYFGQLVGTEINSNNFKIELKVNGVARKILLRKFKSLTNQEQIIFYLNFIRDLKQVGVKVSEAAVSKEGKLSVVYGENYYAVFDFIESTHFISLEESFLSLAKNVAKMHQAFDNFGENHASRIEELSARNPGVYFNKIKSHSLIDFDKIEEIVSKKEKKEEIDNFILENFFLIKSLVEKIKEAEDKISFLPKKIIHSDLHPHNVLMINNDVVAILDFDGMRLSERARDVGCAIYRFGRQFFVNKDISEDEIKKKAVLLREKFLTTYTSILPLEKLEIESMQLIVLDEFLTKLLFVLRSVYEENNKTWAKDLPKFLVALKEINYFWPIL